MEIQTLRLLVTETDLQDLLRKQTPGAPGVRGLAVRLVPEGVRVTGVYDASFLDVPFELLWQLSVHRGQLVARLADVQAGPGLGEMALDVFNLLSPGAARTVLMDAIARALQGQDFARVEGETVVVDPDRLAARNGLTVRFNLVGVRCGQGSLLVECAATG
jgi:hypothetical protein